MHNKKKKPDGNRIVRKVFQGKIQLNSPLL